MRVATILGTRPEIIRLSLLLPLLDDLLGPGNHQVFHTGQNFDAELDGNFWDELKLRPPDFHAGAGGGTFAEQLAGFFPKLENWLGSFQPDRFLVLGDTNSSLGGLVAARMRIPVYHLEAGNRCHGPESPEEVNRHVIDHAATVHLCYSERARMNLVAEGLPLARTFVVGNPLAEVLHRGKAMTEDPGGEFFQVHGIAEGEQYALASLHRAENTAGERLWDFLSAIDGTAQQLGYRVLMSTHPRLRQRLDAKENGGVWYPNISFHKPLPYYDYVKLQRFAEVILSDSGTAPESCAMLRKPLVALRDYMERQELLEAGCCVLWTDRSQISLKAAIKAVQCTSLFPPVIPPEHAPRPVAATVARLLLSPVPPA